MALFSRSDLRLFFLAILMFAGVGSIVARLWELQVMRGDTYASKIGGKSQVTVRIPSVRGDIRDRNGIPLVQNRASYNVDFYLQDMVSGYRRRNGAVPTLWRQTTQRDMLKDTLVIWGGEFGRTPDNGGGDGRGHNAKGYTMWMAGGGVKGGLRYGATDEVGRSAVDGMVHIHDLHATVLALLGLNHEKLTYRYGGRDFRLTNVSGSVVKPIMA